MKSLVFVMGAIVVLCARAADFGVAYYPEAWDASCVDDDLAAIREAGFTHVRMGEFNWGDFERHEGEFDFAPYLRVLDLCAKHGLKAMLCTPTAAAPMWMRTDHPDTEKTRADGSRPPCDLRQSSCPSSPEFRFYADRIVRKMAEAFRDHPAVEFWQIDNEPHPVAGTGRCVCPRCAAGFQAWLKKKYGSLEALNAAWNTALWSSRFTDWGQIRPPFSRSGWQAEYSDYQSDCFVDIYLNAAKVLKEANPKWKVTVNSPYCAGDMRMDRLFGGMDFASYDTYPSVNWRKNLRFHFSMFRNLTGRVAPFTVAETGAFNWDNAKAGNYDIIKAWFWEIVAGGGERVFYFRWRESVMGEEDHPAMLSWNGGKGRGYDILTSLLKEYRSLPDDILTAPVERRTTAILYDCEADLAHHAVTRHDLREAATDAHEALRRCGLTPELVMKGDDCDLSPYRLVVLPMVETVSPALERRLLNFAANGGVLLAVTRLDAIEPSTARLYRKVRLPGSDGLKKLFGIEIREHRKLSNAESGLKDWVERLEPTTAEVLESLTDTGFANFPLLTCNRTGKGAAYYLASVPDEGRMALLMKKVLADSKIAELESLPKEISHGRRGAYDIYVNLSETSADMPQAAGRVVLGMPAVRCGRWQLSPYQVVVLKRCDDGKEEACHEASSLDE